MSSNKHRDAAFAFARDVTNEPDPLFNGGARSQNFMHIYAVERIASAIDRLTDAMARRAQPAKQQDLDALAEAEEEVGK